MSAPHTIRTESNGDGMKIRLVVVFSLLVLIRGVIYAALIPPWQGPDEPQHFEYVRLLYETRRWAGLGDVSPILEEHIIQSMYTFDFPQLAPGIFDEQNPPRTFQEVWGQYGTDTRLGSPSLYHIMAASLQPFASDDLVGQMYLARFVSVVLGIGTVVLAFLALKEVFPHDPFMFIGVPTFVTFLPMYSYIRGVVNSDNLATLFGALAIYVLVLGFTRRRFWTCWGAALALSCLGMLAKKTVLFLIPLTLTAIPVHLGYHKLSRRQLLLGLLLFSVAVLLVVTAWMLDPTRSVLMGWIRATDNLVSQYDSPSMFANALRGLMSRNPLGPAALDLYPIYVKTLFTGFWGYFGWWSIPLSSSWYIGLAAICLAAGLGILLSIGHWIRNPWSLSVEQRQVLLLFGMAVVLAIVIAIAHSLARFFSPTFGRPQGRNIFPALVPIATLFVLGVRGLVPKSFRLHVLAAYVGAFALFDALCVALYIIPAYYGY